MATILVVDDDDLLCELLVRKVGQLGHRGLSALTLAGGLALARSQPTDVVYLDVNMPDGNGLEEITLFREAPGAPEVIIITGRGSPDGAELAIKSGAWDYIEKGAALQSMVLPLLRALQYREERQVHQRPLMLSREQIVGESPRLKACLDLVAQAALSEANVLISGETGTGKELFAQAIHHNSPRRKGNFVVVDCAALPATLVESILFGHARGAFTGADRAREGLVAQAHGGTLFLDEVGELPLSLQKDFLRVLQEKRFRPVGGGQEVASDFRLVAATNRDLEGMAAKGEFRSDLLFRLKGLAINLPPLRERREDLRALLIHHLGRLAERYGQAAKGFTPDFLAMLGAYPWPGNVRELANALDWAFVAAREAPTLFPRHLPEQVRIQAARNQAGHDGAAPAAPAPAAPAPADSASARGEGDILPLAEARARALAEFEAGYLRDLMAKVEGDVSAACRIAGLSRSRLYGLLKQYQLTRRH